MTGRSDRPGREPDALEVLSRVAASRVSRRQLTKLGGALALSALLPEWAVPARAAGLATMAKVTGPCPPQKKGSCDRVRVDWMPGCKTPVAKGSASEFNG